MSDDRVWLRHKEHGDYWHAPAGAVDAWADMGWEPSDPPAEPVSPVVAENLAAQAAAAAEVAAADKATKTSRKSGTDTTTQE